MKHTSELTSDSELPVETRPNDRRRFFEKVGAVIFGSVVAIFPLATGLVVFLDPARKGRSDTNAGRWIRLATLDALPADNLPRRFQVIDQRTDAWSKFESPLGAVYLTRTKEKQGEKLTAFTATCPHLGCSVDYQPSTNQFGCPCHDSLFAADGTKLRDARGRQSVSPRGMDSLDVEIRNGSEIWVKFEKFRSGKAEKIVA
jgi:Rieske Fe-S protein